MLIDELDLKKKYLLLAILAGFISYFVFPEPKFNFKFISHGFYLGLALGLVWAGFKYHKKKAEGIYESRKNFTIFMVYMGAYLSGYVIPYILVKITSVINLF